MSYPERGSSANGLQKAVLEEVGKGRAGCLAHDGSEQVEADVRVGPALTGLEAGVAHAAQVIVHCPDPDRVLQDRGNEVGLLHGVVESVGVVQELAHRDPVGTGNIGVPSGQGRIEGQGAVGHELEHEGGGVGLRDAAELERRVRLIRGKRRSRWTARCDRSSGTVRCTWACRGG